MEKELHGATCASCNTVHAASRAYIHANGRYRGTKMARHRREPAMGTETMKVPPRVDSHTMRYRKEYLNTVYIYIYRSFISIDTYKPKWNTPLGHASPVKRPRSINKLDFYFILALRKIFAICPFLHKSL